MNVWPYTGSGCTADSPSLLGAGNKTPFQTPQLTVEANAEDRLPRAPVLAVPRADRLLVGQVLQEVVQAHEDGQRLVLHDVLPPALPHPVDFGDRLVLKLHDHREPGVLGSVPRVVLVQAFLNVHGEEGPDNGLLVFHGERRWSSSIDMHSPRRVVWFCFPGKKKLETNQRRGKWRARDRRK